MITFNMSLKEYIFLNVSTHALHLNEPYGVNMEYLYPLFKETVKNKTPKIPGVETKSPKKAKIPKL